MVVVRPAPAGVTASDFWPSTESLAMETSERSPSVMARSMVNVTLAFGVVSATEETRPTVMPAMSTSLPTLIPAASTK
jgi:hypothetical protein